MRALRILPVLMLVALANTAGAEDTVEAGSEPSQARWTQLVNSLDAEEFAVREKATKELIAAGLPVLPLVKQIADAPPSNEAVARAWLIRQQIIAAFADRILRVTLQAPKVAVPLCVGSRGNVAVKCWIENVYNEPITLCRPVELATDDPRAPVYAFTLKDEQGHVLSENGFRRSSNPANSLQPEDFVTLKPGERIQVAPSPLFGLNHNRFQDVKSGVYTLTVAYTLPAPKLPVADSGGGKDIDSQLQRCITGTFVSQPVKLALSEQLTDETLIGVLEGEEIEDYPIKYAIYTLRDRKSAKAVKPLCALLKHKDHRVREWTVAALAEFDDPCVVDALLGACNDDDSWVRQDAHRALVTFHDVRVPECYIETGLADTEGVVRREACAMLCLLRRAIEKDIGEKEDFGFDAYLDPDNPKAKTVIAAWKKWWSEHKADYLATKLELKEDD